MMDRLAGCFLALATVLAAAEAPLLTPPVRHASWSATPLALPVGARIVAEGPDERQIAGVLQGEVARLHGVRLAVSSAATHRPHILLALDTSARGQAALARMPVDALWKQDHHRAEAYIVNIDDREATILARSPRGLLYGAQTLLQLMEPEGSGLRLRGASIVDYPQLAFRGVHISIFPDTELESVRRLILVASRYKMNVVALEFWASLRSRKQPLTAYEHTYTPEQVRPIIQFAKALQMDVVPALNSWGHMAGMRGSAQEHAILDRFPNATDLFEPGGWSLCLSNPAIYKFLFDRYDELIELFDHPKYFHVELDEAWGFRGYSACPRCSHSGKKPHELIAAHIQKLHQYFAERNMRILVWHDMFLQRDHPTLGKVSPANSIPEIDSHLALPSVPKDVIIDAWNYDDSHWTVPKYFHDLGYPVVVSPWKTKSNTVSLVNTAKQLNLLGVLTTTWDSMDVVFPPVAQAGVLSWTPPGFDLKTIPFDEWLIYLRKTPLTGLPTYELLIDRTLPGRKSSAGARQSFTSK